MWMHANEQYRITLEVANEKNWLEGPCTVDQLNKMFGTWLPVRRFSVFQKGKVRPIDDMKENRLNMSFGSGEKMIFMLWTRLLLERWNMVSVFGTEVCSEVVSEWLAEHVHPVGLTECML